MICRELYTPAAKACAWRRAARERIYDRVITSVLQQLVRDGDLLEAHALANVADVLDPFHCWGPQYEWALSMHAGLLEWRGVDATAIVDMLQRHARLLRKESLRRWLSDDN